MKKKKISPCYFIYHETNYKLSMLSAKSGITKSSLVDIAIKVLHERSVTDGKLSQFIYEFKEQQKERTLFG